MQINSNDSLLKRLQMKQLLDGQSSQAKEDKDKGDSTPKPTHTNDTQDSLQALDYQALMNSTFVQNTKIDNAKFTLYKLNSAGQKIIINEKEVTIKGSGTFEIAVDGKNVIIKATSNSSSITFDNTDDLNFTVEKGANKSFSLTTGAGNDTVIVAKDAQVSSLITGKGNDNVIIAEGATVKSINTGFNDDTVINFGTITSSIYTDMGADAVWNKGKIKGNINTAEGNDIVQNDGTVEQFIYGGSGNDKIVNNSSANKVQGDIGTDIVINSNKIIFEKKSIKLADNETAVINENGSVTVTKNDVEAKKQTIITYNNLGTEISKEEKQIQDVETPSPSVTLSPTVTPSPTVSIEPETPAFSNSKNEVVCKFLGLDTDKDIKNAQYDAKGNLKSFSIDNKNYTVTYNTSNNITNISAKINNKLSSAIAFTYSSGKLYTRTDSSYTNGVISSKTSRSFRTNGDASSETVTTYDAKGKQASSVATSYNTSGKKSQETTSTYNSGTLTQKVVKSFNADGKTVKKEETTNYVNGKISQTNVKTYNSDSSLKQEVLTNYDNGIIVRTITTDYNSDGTKTVRDIDRNALIFNSELITVYDANDKAVSETSLTYDTSLGKVNAKTEKTFNADGSIKTETVYSFEGVKQTGYTVTTNNDDGTKTVEIYTTDANGVSTLTSTNTVGAAGTGDVTSTGDVNGGDDVKDTNETTYTPINTTEQFQIMSEKANESYNTISTELTNEQTKIKNAAKPQQTQVINDGIEIAKDFEKELKSAIDSYIAKWQADNPGKDIYEIYGSSVFGPLLTDLEVEYNGQTFNVRFADKQLQRIEGKFSNTDETTENYISGNFEYVYEEGYEHYNYSTVTTQGYDGRCLSYLSVSESKDNKSVSKYTALNDGSGENIECNIGQNEHCSWDKYYEILISEDNQLKKEYGYDECVSKNSNGCFKDDWKINLYLKNFPNTIYAIQSWDGNGNTIRKVEGNNLSTGEGDNIIVKNDLYGRVTEYAEEINQNGAVKTRGIGVYSFFGKTNLYETKNSMHFNFIENNINFNDVKYVLGVNSEGKQENYVKNSVYESIRYEHEYEHTVIDDYLYLKEQLNNIETINDENEITGTKLDEKIITYASDTIGEIEIVTTPNQETKQKVTTSGKETIRITDLNEVQQFDGNISDLQQRGIGDCYLLVTLSLLCKNENMNFCNNNIGEIELENGVKVPVSTITKRDDGSVIVSMYNDDGKLCRQIVTKEQLEKTTFKTADGKEVILSNGDLDVKAIEIAAIRYIWVEKK